jgi:hypothetical protein
MATTLPNMGLVQPTPGGDSGVWDDTVNDDLEILDAHRHEAGNGLRIRPAGMDINADLTFNSLYAPKDLHRITFASIVALTSNNKSLFVNTSDNELYWRSNTGTNVKLTAGNALNVAAFTGGFGAGYTSASAAADYDDSTEQYTFKQAAAGNWARLGVGGIRLYEFGGTATTRVGLLSPAALAASYDVTFPAAVPASQQLLQMSSSGVLIASNVLAANESVTVSGTGTYKHGLQTLIVPILSPATPIATISQVTLTTPSNGLGVPISLPVGCRILAVRAVILDNSTGPTTLRCRLRSEVLTVGYSTIASSSASLGNATVQTLTISGLTTVITTGNTYQVAIDNNGVGSATCQIYGVEVDYDRP